MLYFADDFYISENSEPEKDDNVGTFCEMEKLARKGNCFNATINGKVFAKRWAQKKTGPPVRSQKIISES